MSSPVNTQVPGMCREVGVGGYRLQISPSTLAEQWAGDRLCAQEPRTGASLCDILDGKAGGCVSSGRTPNYFEPVFSAVERNNLCLTQWLRAGVSITFN